MKVRKRKHTYIGWTYPCENDHLAFKREMECIIPTYKNNLQKFRDNLNGICDCGKECKPIKVRIIIEKINI